MAKKKKKAEQLGKTLGSSVAKALKTVGVGSTAPTPASTPTPTASPGAQAGSAIAQAFRPKNNEGSISGFSEWQQQSGLSGADSIRPRRKISDGVKDTLRAGMTVLDNTAPSRLSRGSYEDTYLGNKLLEHDLETARQRLLSVDTPPTSGHELTERIQSVRSIGAAVRQQQAYNRQFKNEQDYNNQVGYAAKYKGKTKAELAKAVEGLSKATDKKSQAELAWLQQHQYDNWTQKELDDAIKKSQAEADNAQASMDIFGGSAYRNSAQGWDWETKYNEQGQKKKEAEARRDALRAAKERNAYRDELAKLSEKDLKILSAAGKEMSRMQRTDRVTGLGHAISALAHPDKDPVEIARKRLKELGYDRDQVTDLLDYATKNANAIGREEFLGALQDWERRSDWNKAVGSVVSVPLNVLGGAPGYADVLIQGALGGQDAFTGDHRLVDWNSGMTIYSDAANTMRETASEDMHPVARFFYNAGMSMADSAAAMATGEYVGEALLGSSAAIQAAKEAHERGATDAQALGVGMTAGFMEAAFEHIPMGRLRKMTDTVSLEGLSWKEFAKFAKFEGTQGLTEALEEGGTTGANLIWDEMIMGDKSQIKTAIKEYMADGMSEDKATRQAWKDWGTGLVTDMAAGLLSGVGMGGGSVAIGKARYNGQTSRIGREVEANAENLSLVANGFQFPEGSRTKELADSLVADIRAGKKPTAKQYGELVRAREADVAKGMTAVPNATHIEIRPADNGNIEVVTVQGKTAEALQANGLSASDAVAQGRVLDQLVSGETVSDADFKKLDVESPAVQKVFSSITGAEMPADAARPALEQVFRKAGKEYSEQMTAANEALEREGETLEAVQQAFDVMTAENAASAQEQAAQVMADAQAAVAAEAPVEAAPAQEEAPVKRAETREEFNARKQAEVADLGWELTDKQLDEAWRKETSDGIALSDGGAISREEFYDEMREYFASAQNVTPTDEQLEGLYQKARAAALNGGAMTREAWEQAKQPKASEEVKNSVGDSAIETNEPVADKAESLEQELSGKLLETALKSKGVKSVQFSDKIPGNVNAHINPKTGVITVNKSLTTQKAIYWAVGHEITHGAVEGEYGSADIVDEIIRTFQDLQKEKALKGGVGSLANDLVMDVDAAVAEKQKTYREFFESQGMSERQIAAETTPEKMREEIAADLMGFALASEDILNRLSGEKPKLIVRALRAVRNLFQSENVGDLLSDSNYRATKREIDRLTDRLSSALDQWANDMSSGATESNGPVDAAAEGRYNIGKDNITEEDSNGRLESQTREGVRESDSRGSSESDRAGVPGVREGRRAGNKRLREESGALPEESRSGQRPGSKSPVDARQLLLSPESKSKLQRSKVYADVYDTTADPAAFSSALDAARESDVKNGWAVTPKTEQELRDSGATLIMADGNTAGLAVTPSGDIEALFSNKVAGAPKGISQTLLPLAIEAGGRKLDCYGPGLARVYSKFGFVPVARTEFNPEYANPGWTPNKGQPDIYFMMYTGPASADAVVNSYDTYPALTADQLDALPLMDYDAAATYRDEQLGYLKAVESGDMRKAQRMVDEAAKAAGYDEVWAHGTANAIFTSFDLSKAEGAKAVFLSDRGTASQYAGTTRNPIPTRLIGRDVETIEDALSEIRRIDDGFHQPQKVDGGYKLPRGQILGRTPKPVYSESDVIEYANKLRQTRNGGVYSLYVNFGKKLTVDAKNAWWNRIRSDYGSTTDEIGTWALNHGYDSVEINNVHDGGFNISIPSDVVLVFDANQLKSTDPVTYDDDGNVIPLSERFNPENPDIRYSAGKNPLADLDRDYAAAVESGDTEAAQRMVDEAAKRAGYDIKAYHGTRSENFNVFDPSRSGENYGGYNAEGGGISFTRSEDWARRWGAKARGDGDIRVVPAYLKTQKTFYSYNGAVDPELRSELPDDLSESEKDVAMANGATFHKTLEDNGVNFKEAILRHGYDSYSMYPGADNIAVYDPAQVKSADPVTYDDNGNVIPLSERFNPENPDIRYSISGPVQGLYNLSERVIGGMKQDKFGAASVVNMLRGKGVKAEEIKWLGIEDFLKGKKSVTKQELLDYIRANDLALEETTLSDDSYAPAAERSIDQTTGELYEDYESAYSTLYDRMAEQGYDEGTIEGSLLFDDNFGFYWNDPETGEVTDLAILAEPGNTFSPTRETHWSGYTTPGGTNYRELLIKMPGSRYTNRASERHWGDKAPGVMAHARVQDFTDTNGRPLLFVEEIQSDWHNEAAQERPDGSKVGYRDVNDPKVKLQEREAELRKQRRSTDNRDEYARLSQQINAVRDELYPSNKPARELSEEAERLRKGEDLAGVRNNPYVIAAAKSRSLSVDYMLHQVNSELSLQNFISALVIEHTIDHDANKPAAPIGPDELAKVRDLMEVQKAWLQAETQLLAEQREGYDPAPPDAPFAKTYTDFVLKRLLREAAENGYDGLAWTTAEMQADRWSDAYMEGYRIEYDQDIPKFLNKFGKKFGAKVGWTELDSDGEIISVPYLPITDEMRASVLENGLPKFSVRGRSPAFDAWMDSLTKPVGTPQQRSDVARDVFKGYGMNGKPTQPAAPRASKVKDNTYKRMGIKHMFTEEHARAYDEADMTYDPVSEQESMRRADERLTADYDGEKAKLNQQDWRSGEDLDTAMGILVTELRVAKDTGNYDEVLDWMHTIREQGTKAGQFIQAFAKYNRTPEGILVRAAEDLEDVTRLTPQQKEELLGKIATFAKTLNALRPNADGTVANPNGLVDLIVEQAKQRNTPVPKHVLKALKREVKNGEVQYLYDFALTQLGQITKDYIPASLGKKVAAFQTIAHLFNLRTGGRNLVSNTLFGSLAATANNVAMIPDTVLSLMTGGRSVGFDAGHFHKSTWQGIKNGGSRSRIEVALDVDPDINSHDKYGTSRRTWKMTGNWVQRNLSRVEKAMAYELNWTDEFRKGGVRAEIIHSLAPLVEKGTISMETAKAWAEDEALYRTFQDDTYINKLLAGVKKVLNTGLVTEYDANGGKHVRVGQLEFGLGDIVQKYTQVPGALLTRAIEFAPTGYAKAFYHVARLVRQSQATKKANAKAAEAAARAEAAQAGTKKARADRAAAAAFRAAKNQEITTRTIQREAALAFGRAMTGTGLIAFFAAITKAGLLRRDDDEVDANAKALRTAEGVSGTQLNFSALERLVTGGSAEWQQGDILMDVGFLEPINNLMTMGAKISGDDEDANAWDYTLDTFDALYRSMLEIPTMQTAQTIYNTAKYHQEDSPLPVWAEIPIEVALSGAGGFVPAPIRQLAQATDPYYRDTYASRKLGDRALASIQNNIPFWRKQLPTKLDSFGRDREQEAPALNAANAFLIPGAVRTYKPDAVANEVLDFYERTGEANILPARNAPYTVETKSGKKELTAEERRAYQQTVGGIEQKEMGKAIANKEYKKAPKDVRADVWRNLKSYATAEGKRKVGGKAEIPRWTERGEGTLVDKSIAYAWLGEARSTLPNKGSSPNGEQIGAVADLDLSQEMTSQVLAQFLEGSSLEKVNGAQNLGITLDTYSDVLIACGEKQMPADKDANGKTINGSRKKKVVAYLSDLVQSGTITREQMNYFITTVYGWKL